MHLEHKVITIGHAFSGDQVRLEHELYYAWEWMLWSPYALGRRTLSWFGHACSGHQASLQHERQYGLDVGALVTLRTWNTNRYHDPLHGFLGSHMGLEHERYHVLGKEALVIRRARTRTFQAGAC